MGLRGPRPKVDEEAVVTEALHEEGTLRVLGAKFGLSPEGVRHLLKRKGVYRAYRRNRPPHRVTKRTVAAILRHRERGDTWEETAKAVNRHVSVVRRIHRRVIHDT